MCYLGQKCSSDPREGVGVCSCDGVMLEPGSFLSLQRPWHEYEHNFQIMYKVGMGHKPPIPERLSPEGKDFLSHCLESDPKMRWTASQLLDHAFVKVWPVAAIALFVVKHLHSFLYLAQGIWTLKYEILISKRMGTKS